MIPLLIEPTYGGTHWAEGYLAGVRDEAQRRGMKALAVTPGQWKEGKPVMVLGTTALWLRDCLAYLAAKATPAVLAGAPPAGCRCAFVSPDYEAATERFARLTAHAPGGKRALFAIHPASAADGVKRASFEALCPDGVVYENTGSLLAAAQRLADGAPDLRAVLCANDVAAMVLRRALHAAPAKPELYAFGDQRLPPEEGIAVFRMELLQAGRQAVQLYRAVEKEPTIRRCAWIPCALEGGPALTACPQSAAPAAPDAAGSFYQDPQVPEAFQFKTLLNGMDGLDLDIIRELLVGRRYFDMAELLHTTENTLKYRLKRMMERAGVAGRGELLRLVRGYLAADERRVGGDGA